MSNLQDLEEQFLRCWELTQDLTLIAEEHEDNDDLCNKVLGVKHVLEMRFEKAWGTYEKLVEEYYAMKKGTKSK